MNPTLCIDCTWVELVNLHANPLLSEFYAQHADLISSDSNPAQISLIADYQTQKNNKINHYPGLSLIWHRGAQAQTLHYHLDFVKAAQQLRSFPAPKQGALNQALGKKSKHLLDGTGGWASDAWRLCLQGYQVTITERQPIMALLLADAFARLADAHHKQLIVPTVYCADVLTRLDSSPSDSLSVHSLQASSPPAIDCLYYDPMFSPKRKTSAAAQKNIQLLQFLLRNTPNNTQQVLHAAINSTIPRIVVKQPHYGEPLLNKLISWISWISQMCSLLVN